jgi:predicted MFS family arabinose efflux permease
MPILIRAFNMNISNAGMLMAIFAITGFLLAIPSGFILQKFGPKNTGLTAVGFVVAGSVMGALAASFGWQSVWWAGAAFASVAFLLYVFLFRMPKTSDMTGRQPLGAAEGREEKSPGLGATLTNGSLWLVTLELMCFNIAVLALSTFYPTFLNTERNFSLASASFVSSLMMLATIFSAPLGWPRSNKQ